jgi:hypothetical protein
MKKFKLGDIVTWSSQAHGSTKTKIGPVVEVVKPGALPDREMFPRLYQHSGVGCSRPDTSYVVLVKTKEYWPRAAALLLANAPRQVDEMVLTLQIATWLETRATAAPGSEPNLALLDAATQLRNGSWK